MVNDSHSKCFQINLGPTGPPLIVQTTHPRVLFELAFLVSSISKRDLVGRRPRRKIFAEEGLKISDTVGEDMFCRPRLAFFVTTNSLLLIVNFLLVPVWASLGDAREVEDRLAKIKADLLCEMAAVRINRCISSLVIVIDNYACSDRYNQKRV